jgi:hypothetical protein
VNMLSDREYRARFLAWAEKAKAKALKVEGYEWTHTGGNCTALVRLVVVDPSADKHYEFWMTDDMGAPEQWAAHEPSKFTECCIEVGFYPCGQEGEFLQDEPLESTQNITSEEELRAFERMCLEKHGVVEWKPTWTRTCQECGNKQKDVQPSRDKELAVVYKNRKCKRCKSEALDYGSLQ